MSNAHDDRSPMAKALSKVTEITTISLMMIVPAMIGYFVDQYFDMLPLFTVIGAVFGMGGAIWQLIAFVSSQEKSKSTNVKPLPATEEDSDQDDWNRDDESEDSDKQEFGGW